MVLALVSPQANQCVRLAQPARLGNPDSLPLGSAVGSAAWCTGQSNPQPKPIVQSAGALQLMQVKTEADSGAARLRALAIIHEFLWPSLFQGNRQNSRPRFGRSRVRGSSSQSGMSGGSLP